MKWKLILHGSNSGKFNMDFDIDLARKCGDDVSYFRLYGWKPYAISLGANQNENEIDSAKAEMDGIDIVKRPTGGRAILHAEEITYSVVVPANSVESSKWLYNKISTALVAGLKIFHPEMRNLELESLQPHFPSLLKEPKGMICFSSTARHEVKYKGRKLIGSAQRKINGVILQHGSVLGGDFHLKLVDYLRTGDTTRGELRENMKSKTVSIEQILGTKFDYEHLNACLIEGFEKTWNISFEKDKLETV